MKGSKSSVIIVPLSEAKKISTNLKERRKWDWASRGTWNKKHVFNLQTKHKKQHLENQTKQFHKNIVEDSVSESEGWK